ncbi:AraC family transcriptional regulator [Ruegeria aquimaris]|uniref:AraC family transcriptional regulator n=1 Tax=Ruegeria aquimaris TaxID=2984333 RepID=A0ABT3AJM0_9RHOB|nr:AraC family transcriptional regulator [Ruegeria sp. XHP0148]MCV2888376.1 AraC family transcriptional regulator [Ruegeria sp. XHP0148]
MKRSKPTHGAVYVQTLAADLLKQGYTARQVFAGTGFGPGLLEQSKPVAPFEDIAGFFEHAAALTGDDAIGFRMGTVREMRRMGLIRYVGMSSPTVRTALMNIARYRRVFSDAVEIDVQRLDSEGLLRWHFAVPSKVRRRQFVEFGAAGLIQDLRQASNRRFSLVSVDFSHPRKTHLAEFDRFFGCAVRFGRSGNQVVFSQEVLDTPLVTADDALYSVLIDHCELVLKDKSRNMPAIIVDVERAIADRLASGTAAQEEIARDLGMSTRTLSRRLAEEKTTFQKIMEQLRASLASSYLRDSDLSLAEIAFLLGYSGLSSFSEAFKRWTGQSPGQYRTG